MISVVIPTYNRKNCLAALLECLSAQTIAAEVEIIVVDDCSTDGTAALVTRQFPHVILLRNDRNCGPAVSRNRGARQARGEFVVGFDSDVTLIDPQLLIKVHNKFRARPDAAGFALRLFQPDGSTEDVARWWHARPAKLYAHKEFPTDYFSGTAYALRKEDMLMAGLFPEILYMHYEEVELAFRILDNGGQIFYCPDLTVVHHASETSQRSEVKVFYKPRNQVLVMLRCYPWLLGIKYLVPRAGYNLFTATIQGHLHRFLQAMVSAMWLMRRCLKDRRPLKTATWQRIASLRAFQEQAIQVIR